MYCGNTAIQSRICYGLLSSGRGWLSVPVRIALGPANLGAGSGARRDSRAGRRSKELGCGRSGCQRPQPRALRAAPSSSRGARMRR